MIVILGPNDPYDLLTDVMTRVTSRTLKCTFAPEWMHDHTRVAKAIESAESVITVTLDDKEDPDTTANTQEALRQGKKVTRYYYASNVYNRKKFRTDPLTFIRSEVLHP